MWSKNNLEDISKLLEPESSVQVLIEDSVALSAVQKKVVNIFLNGHPTC